MFDRFTDRSHKVLALANQEAHRLNHALIGAEHILLGLIKEGSGVGAVVLKNLGIDLHKARLDVQKLVQSESEMVIMPILPWSPCVKNIIECATNDAQNLGHKYVGTEHLLLGLLHEKNSMAAKILQNFGIKLEAVRKEVLQLLGNPTHSERTGEGKESPVLPMENYYPIDSLSGLGYLAKPSRQIDVISIAMCLVVLVLHCVLQFILYQDRVVSDGTFADSDLFVFGLPNVLAFAAYAAIFRRWARIKPWNFGKKVGFVIGLTLAAGFLSFWCSMLIPINTYGT